MTTLDFIGLDSASANKTIKELQKLLADVQVFYNNLRGFHWNVKSDQFFTLHAKFEELYNEVNDQVDQIAERILSLGGIPQNKFSEFLKLSDVQEVGTLPCPVECVKSTLEAYKVIIAQERVVQEIADSGNDEVTADMMTDYLAGQEKTVWMLVAYLTERPKA